MPDDNPSHKTTRGGLREAMPEVSAFIDALRETFGVDEIHAAIRGGMAGEPTFYARENGREIGTKASAFVGPRISPARGWCAGCNGECVGTAQQCVSGP